jgi:hypothetical protein
LTALLSYYATYGSNCPTLRDMCLKNMNVKKRGGGHDDGEKTNKRDKERRRDKVAKV